MKTVSLGAALLMLWAMPAGGQLHTGQETELMLGIGFQNDVAERGGVRLSPLGMSGGFIIQPVFGNRRAAVIEQLSLFPVSKFEREPIIAGVRSTTTEFDRPKPLIVNTIMIRLATKEPELSRELTWFGGAGITTVLTTPRTGTRLTPLLMAGARIWWDRQFGLEASIQCGLWRVGETACVLPITTLWPVGS
jgi:hypothetical protein